MSVTVRHWTQTDISSVLPLMRDLAVFEGNLDLFKATHARLLERGFQTSPPDCHCLIAERGAQIIGILLYQLLPLSDEPEIIVTDLFVSQSARRQGAGRALMQRVALEARSAGCELVRWALADGNEAAQRFYESLGARANPNWVSYGLDRAGLETLAGQP